MPDIPSLLLAADPGCTPPPLPVPVERVHTGYALGSAGTLLRSPAEGRWQGGYLMVNGRTEALCGALSRLCRQIGEEAHRRAASGVVVNWDRSPAGVELVRGLEEELTRAGRSVWVPEEYGDVTGQARILISSQLSGGTLRDRLQAARVRWGERAALAVECVPWRFPLPCRPGEEQPLTGAELERMLERQHRVWFSESLCAQYFTCLANRRLALVLFDDGVSLRRKLELAAQVGISGAVLSWEEIAPFAKDCFPEEGLNQSAGWQGEDIFRQSGA